MKKLVNTFMFTLITLMSSYVSAQGLKEAFTDTSEVKEGIGVIARPYQDSIVVKWAPKNRISWKLALQRGYNVYRMELMRDSVLVKDPNLKKLNETPIKPISLEAWELLAEKNNYAGIAAQAIYGQNLELDAPSGGIMDYYNRSQLEENTYSFALMVTEFSKEVAYASGLMYCDSTAEKGVNYIYEVVFDDPSLSEEFGRGYTSSILGEFYHTPFPEMYDPVFDEYKVMLSWKNVYDDYTYGAYNVYRSDDNAKTFKKINKLPISSGVGAGKLDSTIFIYNDSVPELKKKYIYRIKGIDPFAEESDFSNPVFGFALPKLHGSARIMEANPINNKQINLKWNYSDTTLENVKGYDIFRGANLRGDYERLTEKILKPKQTTFLDENPGNSNYYVIKVYGEFGDSTLSNEYFMPLIDSTPPAKVIGLTAKVDTSGIATVSWDKNEEADLLGYRVYVANYLSEEFTRTTDSFLVDSFFIDTLNLHTLTKQKYFSIVAIDKHFNPSEMSEPLPVAIPDTLAPAQPVIKSYKSLDGAIQFFWGLPVVEDTDRLLIYRRLQSDGPWELIKESLLNDSLKVGWLDKQVARGVWYQYAIALKDVGGLESQRSIPVSVRVYDSGIRPEINAFTSLISVKNQMVKLSWQYQERRVKNFIIYRAKKGEKMRVLTSVQNTKREYYDKNLQKNQAYIYRLQAVFDNGARSPFTDEIEVILE